MKAAGAERGVGEFRPNDTCNDPKCRRINKDGVFGRHTEATEGEDPSEDYCRKAEAIAYERITLAGYRLSAELSKDLQSAEEGQQDSADGQ